MNKAFWWLLAALLTIATKAVVRFLPYRKITRENGEDYLDRWYLCGDPSCLRYFPEGTKQRWFQRPFSWLPTIYVHRFVADDSEELHNHPWGIATSFIISGSYVDWRRVSRPYPHHYVVVPKLYRAGDMNRLSEHDFHRVTLASSEVWTLFRCGARHGRSWGFWDPFGDTNEFVPWREHAAREKRAEAVTKAAMEAALIKNKGEIASCEVEVPSTKPERK